MEAIIIIQIVSVFISIAAPTIFYFILREGIRKSNFKSNVKSKYITILLTTVSAWVALVYFLTANDVFAYSPEEIFPKFLFGLLIPVVIVLALFANKNFKMILSNISFNNLAFGQLWRVLGAVFFLVATSGIGPIEFINSGIGDVTTGLVALVAIWALSKNLGWSKLSLWALLSIGITDLLVVLFILLTKYPIWSDAVPSTAMAGSFPMMLIIGIAAPIALLLHLFMLRKLIIRYKG